LYQPPYHITPAILTRIAEIGEAIGRYSVFAEQQLTPRLRRRNRIRTIQASLAIEQNSLTLEQVTAVIAGKPVLGHPREIQEVRNAFAAYEAMDTWDPCSEQDLLAAHDLLMQALAEQTGRYRAGGVGIFRGRELVHMAPPAERVPQLMADLLSWLADTDEHPLVASCVFHYEFEFIHPFADGNGRMGRLWQTLILRRWKPLLAYLPVETLIRERQDDYYRVLAEADQQADATAFIDFMLGALNDALREAVLPADPDDRAASRSTDQVSDQVSDQVTDQVAALLRAIGTGERGSSDLMQALGLSHRPTFRQNYVNPALAADLIARTQPDAPRSPSQRYRLTVKGERLLRRIGRGAG
jgi:Fic family protein